ncbi:MAG TPA: DNA methyltransferase [Candidatus Sumerlaeota bacterium]|nr:DNA methyltransferase [Candidatus Sumerlaeota bacterium]HRR29710.1 DNA methyltransferase [Candidatus Sumerlaeia bacterium]HON50378.1 DNA methyltransferase [Candidatus Sumerlaeota bacterium]HOR63594.1 DNA methyltransferase [Candidatus Sumerlaeota bacterium]HPL73560.1 DNA methyltransferase [Candidatus Sumerlaeota bacterium]
MMNNIVTYLADFHTGDKSDLFHQDRPITKTDEILLNETLIPRFINEFWTSSQRQSHSLHEISYRACFKAELPRFFINQLTKYGDLVYDPFMGRGTTLLEAALLGREVAGNDINPLSRILIEPRINPPPLAEIHRRLQEIPWNLDLKPELDLSMFYSPATERMIVSLKEYLLSRKEENTEDYIDKWIRMVATNRLTGHSSGFFSVYTLPPNQAVSPEAQIKINEKRKQVPTDRDVPAIIEKKSIRLQKDLTVAQAKNLQHLSARSRYFCQDAQISVTLEDETVALVVTSPPFLDTVQYAADNWLRCWFNHIDAQEFGRHITMSRTIEEWSYVMKNVFIELKRLLKPGGWIAFEVGEVRNRTVMLDEVIAPIGISVGLECCGIVINQQEFTKTANCWGIKNNQLGTNTNRIVLFQKV